MQCAERTARQPPVVPGPSRRRREPLTASANLGLLGATSQPVKRPGGTPLRHTCLSLASSDVDQFAAIIQPRPAPARPHRQFLIQQGLTLEPEPLYTSVFQLL